MKRFIFGLLITLIVVYIIPPIIILSLCQKATSAKRIKQEPPQTVAVLNAETNEISLFDLEEYLVGVVSAEMPASYKTEALKAQAVAARSYILNKSQASSSAHKEAVICTNPAHCKAYISEKDAREKWGAAADKYLSRIKAAVSATRGEYISYDGEAALACFCAASGGRTENAADVWGTETPYLKSVESPGDLTYENQASTVSISSSEACEKLGISSCDIGEISRTEGGAVKTLSIGGKTFSGTQIRSALGLNSANFTVKADKNRLIFTSKGNGHGVGMSQYGANQMAKQGKNYTEILLHYYSNVTIEKL